jgi:hypothetical protein
MVGMVGMVGIVVPFEDGETCDIPDAGGVPVYLNWPDNGLHGRAPAPPVASPHRLHPDPCPEG